MVVHEAEQQAQWGIEVVAEVICKAGGIGCECALVSTMGNKMSELEVEVNIDADVDIVFVDCKLDVVVVADNSLVELEACMAEWVEYK